MQKIDPQSDLQEKYQSQMWVQLVASNFNEIAPYIFVGTGTPEGSVTAGIGATFHRTDGGAGTSFYVKETGTGNTGWVGK